MTIPKKQGRLTDAQIRNHLEAIFPGGHFTQAHIDAERDFLRARRRRTRPQKAIVRINQSLNGEYD